MATENPTRDGSRAPVQQQQQQASATARVARSPAEADPPRHDPARRTPRPITDWASI